MRARPTMLLAILLVWADASKPHPMMGFFKSSTSVTEGTKTTEEIARTAKIALSETLATYTPPPLASSSERTTQIAQLPPPETKAAPLKFKPFIEIPVPVKAKYRKFTPTLERVPSGVELKDVDAKEFAELEAQVAKKKKARFEKEWAAWEAEVKKATEQRENRKKALKELAKMDAPDKEIVRAVFAGNKPRTAHEEIIAKLVSQLSRPKPEKKLNNWRFVDGRLTRTPRNKVEPFGMMLTSNARKTPMEVKGGTSKLIENGSAGDQFPSQAARQVEIQALRQVESKTASQAKRPVERPIERPVQTPLEPQIPKLGSSFAKEPQTQTLGELLAKERQKTKLGHLLAKERQRTTLGDLLAKERQRTTPADLLAKEKP